MALLNLNLDPGNLQYLFKVLAIACFAGAIQAVTPDRWFPLSIVAWKRRWSFGGTLLRSSALLTLHVLLAVGIYKLLDPVFGGIAGQEFWTVAFAIVMGMAFLRYLRFERIHLILRSAPESRWTALQAFLLMGFSEGLLPILIKLSNPMEPSLWIAVSLAYLVGTLIAGVGATLVSGMRLERPFWIPEALRLSAQGGAVLPLIASVLVIALF